MLRFGLRAVAAALLLSATGCEPVVVANSPAACAYELQATLPLTFKRNLPHVQASVNGHPMTMLFDTGSQGSVLFDGVAPSIGVRTDWGMLVQTSGVNGMGVQHLARADSVEVGGYKVADVPMAIAHAAPSIAEGADGVLGGDLLRRFDLDIDYAQSRVSLYRWRSCPSGGPNWGGIAYHTVMPMFPLQGRDHVIVRGTLDDKPVSVLLDTGANGMAVLRETALRGGVTAEALDTDAKTEVSGLGADALKVAVHRFRSLTVGGISFLAPYGGVADTPVRVADVVLGTPLFRPRRVWISYGSDRVYIARN